MRAFALDDRLRLFHFAAAACHTLLAAATGRIHWRGDFEPLKGAPAPALGILPWLPPCPNKAERSWKNA